MTVCFVSGRDLQIESLKRDLELLRAELERVKAEVQTVGAESLAAWVSHSCLCIQEV